MTFDWVIKATFTVLADIPTSKYQNWENHEKIVHKRGELEENRKILDYNNVKKSAFDPPRTLPKMFVKEYQTDFKWSFSLLNE